MKIKLIVLHKFFSVLLLQLVLHNGPKHLKHKWRKVRILQNMRMNSSVVIDKRSFTTLHTTDPSALHTSISFHRLRLYERCIITYATSDRPAPPPSSSPTAAHPIRQRKVHHDIQIDTQSFVSASNSCRLNLERTRIISSGAEFPAIHTL